MLSALQESDGLDNLCEAFRLKRNGYAQSSASSSGNGSSICPSLLVGMLPRVLNGRFVIGAAPIVHVGYAH